MENFSCENLYFYYGKKMILNNISFEIKKGDVVALVGYNGVGKTTLLKILAKLTKENIFNRDYTVSFLIEKPAFYPYLTGYQNLAYFSKLPGKSLLSLEEALAMVGLTKDKNIKYQKYSLGMKERLGIAKCLLKSSDIYLFDEPLNGLDAKKISEFRHIIKFLKSLGKTIVISSHILHELDMYCNKLLILNNEGKILEFDLYANKGPYLGKIENVFLKGQHD